MKYTIGRRIIDTNNSPMKNDFDSNFRSMQEGIFTMHKLMIGLFVVVFVLIIASMFMSVGMRASGQYEQHAREQAQNWATNMYPGETAHVSCQNADTDNNGYVSCTIRIGERAPMGIECSVPMSLNNGCRIPPLQNMLQRENQ